MQRHPIDAPKALEQDVSRFTQAGSALKRQEKINTAAKLTCYSCCLFSPVTLPYMAYQKHQLKKETAAVMGYSR